MIRGAWRLEHRQEDSSGVQGLSSSCRSTCATGGTGVERAGKGVSNHRGTRCRGWQWLTSALSRRAFPALRGISGCPFLGFFWLVFSEGLQSSWKPLCLELPILETLFLFISIWVISVYDLCTVVSCGSLVFGMWACPVLLGRKQLLPAQCREVALACSEGNLVNFFSREKTWLMVK